jgi:hypothetical protein
VDSILTIRRSRHWPAVALSIAAVALVIVIAMAGFLKVQDYLETRNPPTPTKFFSPE